MKTTDCKETPTTPEEHEERAAWRILDVRGEEPDPGARYDHEPTGLPLGYHAEQAAAAPCSCGDFVTGYRCEDCDAPTLDYPADAKRADLEEWVSELNRDNPGYKFALRRIPQRQSILDESETA